MSTYILSIAARKDTDEGTVFVHAATYTEAADRNEATAYGIRKARRNWPEQDGWTQHSASTIAQHGAPPTSPFSFMWPVLPEEPAPPEGAS